MKVQKISTEFIKLSQLLKLAGIVGQGSEVKILLEDESVLVNDKIVKERGKKIFSGDIVAVNGENILVEANISEE